MLQQQALFPSRPHPALYVNHQSGEFLGVHVDDLLWVAKSENQFTKWLGSYFTVHDLGRPQHLLSIELEWIASTVTLAQVAYVSCILRKYLPSGTKRLASPLSPSERPLKRDELEPSADLQEYQSAIGSLLYAALITRPDILFAVCCLSQFLSDLSESHIQMVKNIFHYLAHMVNFKLTYHQQKKHQEGQLSVYSDASYANSLSDRHSFSSSVTFYTSCAIAWFSAKQGVVALSTMESEYIAQTLAAQSLAWVQGLLHELQISSPSTKPILYGDNIISHFRTPNATLHGPSKHMDVRYHYLREQYEHCRFELEFLSGKENPTDLFTNALPRNRLSYLCSYFFA